MESRWRPGGGWWEGGGGARGGWGEEEVGEDLWVQKPKSKSVPGWGFGREISEERVQIGRDYCYKLYDGDCRRLLAVNVIRVF